MEIIKHSYRSVLKDITGSHHKFTSFISLTIMVLSIFVVQRLIQTPQFIGSRASETQVHYEQLPEARGGKLRLRSTPPKNEKTVYIIATNTTYDENTEIIIDDYVLLDIQEGATLTINGKLTAPEQHVFTGKGKVEGHFVADQLDSRWFGVVPNQRQVDNEHWLRLRHYLSQDDGRTVYFPPGLYNHKFPYWLKGVKDVKILGYGAKIGNIMEPGGTKEDWDGEFPEKSPYEHDWVNAITLNWEFFIDRPRDFEIYRDASLEGLYGNLIDTADTGSTKVTLKEPYDLSEFDVGDYVVVYGRDTQIGGYPLNAIYHEINKITAINGNTISLEKPLKHEYRDDWFEDLSVNRFVSKARIQTLNRTHYNIAERIVFEGIELLDNPHNTPEVNDHYYNGERASISGAINVEMVNCKVHSMSPQEVESLIVTGCTFGDAGPNDSGLGIENDKFGGIFTYDDIAVNGQFTGGAGVDNIVVKNSSINGKFGTTARDNYYEKNVLNGTVQGGLLYFSPSAPVYKTTLINNTIITDEDTNYFLLPGRVSEFSVNEVLPDGSITAIRNPDINSDPIIPYLVKGTYIWNVNGNAGAIRQVSENGADKYLIKHNLKNTPQVGETYFFSRTQELVFEGNTFQGKEIPPYRWDALIEQLPVKTINGQNNAHTFRLENISDWTRRTVLGNIERITFDVQTPYGGDANYILSVFDLDEPTKRFAKIDLRTPGVREIYTDGNSGNIGFDTLYTTNNDFVQTLQFNVAKSPGWTPENLPTVEVTVYYKNPFTN